MSSVLRRTADTSAVRTLRDAHRTEFAGLVDADPIANSVVAARLAAAGTLEPRHLGGTVLGLYREGGLCAAAFHGGNLLPVGGAPHDWRQIAEWVANLQRGCGSIVGRADAVAAYWQVLAPSWGPARAIREAQPLLVSDGRSLATPDSRVRPARPDELDAYLPAAVAMFTEELGVAPDRLCGNADYRRRIAGLIHDRRALAIVEPDGRIAFKADIGAVSRHTAQVQGVWVRPELRGHGLGTAAMAAVLRYAATLAPSVSLYVNDYNEPARRMYARLGMRQVATLSTVLF